MTYRELAQIIGNMTTEQRSQEVLFVDSNDDGNVRGVSLMIATEDICELEPNDVGELEPTDNVMIPNGMPFLE